MEFLLKPRPCTMAKGTFAGNRPSCCVTVLLPFWKDLDGGMCLSGAPLPGPGQLSYRLTALGSSCQPWAGQEHFWVHLIRLMSFCSHPCSLLGQRSHQQLDSHSQARKKDKMVQGNSQAALMALRLDRLPIQL